MADPRTIGFRVGGSSPRRRQGRDGRGSGKLGSWRSVLAGPRGPSGSPIRCGHSLHSRRAFARLPEIVARLHVAHGSCLSVAVQIIDEFDVLSNKSENHTPVSVDRDRVEPPQLADRDADDSSSALNHGPVQPESFVHRLTLLPWIVAVLAKAGKCYPCARNELLPFCQEGQPHDLQWVPAASGSSGVPRQVERFPKPELFVRCALLA
jgi:hypothetical protein